MNGVTKFYISVVILLLVGFYCSDVQYAGKVILSFLMAFIYLIFCVVTSEDLSSDGQLKYWSIFYWIGEFYKWLNKIDD